MRLHKSRRVGANQLQKCTCPRPSLPFPASHLSAGFEAYLRCRMAISDSLCRQASTIPYSHRCCVTTKLPQLGIEDVIRGSYGHLRYCRLFDGAHSSSCSTRAKGEEWLLPDDVTAYPPKICQLLLSTLFTDTSYAQSERASSYRSVGISNALSGK